MIACVVCYEAVHGIVMLAVLSMPFIGGFIHRYIKKHKVHGDANCDCVCHTDEGKHEAK